MISIGEVYRGDFLHKYDHMKEKRSEFTRTKIVCTIGPMSRDRKVISALLDAGMDIARINLSHGDENLHKATFGLLRQVAVEKGVHLSILCDIQGPKIRTGEMAESFRVNEGDRIELTSRKILGTSKMITIAHPGLERELDIGDEVFIDDGTIRLKVIETKTDSLLCEVRSGGIISDRKGCNIPSSNIRVDMPTEKDIRDLGLIAELDPEYVAASFVGNPEDVCQIRDVLRKNGNESVKLISKIERPVALKNLQGIIDVSDGIMVARGDLGVEIPVQEVPAAQKEMCRLANKAGIPVIVATQMLTSMIEHSRPTRAEASDVFNAVLDGTDAVMLSNETAVGKDPVLVVKTMKDILRKAEEHFPFRDPDYYDSDQRCMIETIGHSAFTLVKEFDDRKYSGSIVAVTDSGQSARMISKYRPNRTILAVTPNVRTARELGMVWGVVPVYSEDVSTQDLEDRMTGAVKTAFDLGLLEIDDHAIVVSSSTIVGDDGIFSGVYRVSSLIWQGCISQDNCS
jgi:pyruvate kinase